MKIIKHNQPKLLKSEFKCDEILSKYLIDDPLLKNMNKSFCCGLVSKAGGGKTTHLTSLIQTRGFFKKFSIIFIYLCH